MSFDALKAADVTAKKKEVVIQVGENSYVFTATEISYMQRLNLAAIQHAGGDAFTQLMIYSIVDADGRHMSAQQANALAPEHAEKLFVAATEVNQQDTTEKN